MNTNVVKTLNYIRRNGIFKTVYAVKERKAYLKSNAYTYVPIDESTRLSQVQDSVALQTGFSLLVPAYETDPKYLKAMIESVRAQTHGKWELIIADASKSNVVADAVSGFDDIRIKYVRLEENGGIAANTVAGLKYCTEEYTGLLDHDDLLTNDALYCMASAIEKYKAQNITLQLLYSDEDKTNSDNTAFFEPNFKPDFNTDLLLSNNYICHFLVIRTELLKSIPPRSEYDGAQDHDLLLRAVSKMGAVYGRRFTTYTFHIPKVLYHWRCHEKSTAANPKSKGYAYDAGRRAVEDFLRRENINGSVEQTEHVGFFHINYEPDIFTNRPQVGGVGGRIINRKNIVVAGPMDETGKVMFEGLHKRFSGGILHRAACQMQVPYIDVRNAVLCSEGEDVLQNIKEKFKDGFDTDPVLISLDWCDTMRGRGYIFIYEPKLLKKLKKRKND